MTWSGMRGLVTLILALSIPVVNGTEQVRQDAIVMMLSVLFFTLVLPGLTLPMLVKVLGVRANHEEETAVPELLKIAQDAALEALQAEAKASTDPETYARVMEMCSAITRRDEISEALPEEYKQHMEKIKGKRNDFVRLRDAALVAAQNEVIAAQDRYDSHDVTRVVRKLDILAQAESIRSSGVFILPAMTAGAVAMERYNLWKKYQGTLSTRAIPVVENAPASPLVTSEVTPQVLAGTLTAYLNATFLPLPTARKLDCPSSLAHRR